MRKMVPRAMSGGSSAFQPRMAAVAGNAPINTALPSNTENKTSLPMPLRSHVESVLYRDHSRNGAFLVLLLSGKS